MISRSTNAGFTLLEMVVVLVLIGMMTALVGPNLQAAYSATAGATERQDLALAMNRLALDVRDAGRTVFFSRGRSWRTSCPLRARD